MFICPKNDIIYKDAALSQKEISTNTEAELCYSGPGDKNTIPTLYE